MTSLMNVVRALGPRADKRFLSAMERDGARLVVKYGIDTPTALAEVLGEMAHETQGFRKFVEPMGYSARRLTQVWPNRFPTLAAAAPYANNPEKLANFTYANRMGNGPPSSGDGWLFRGGGLLHHTGRAEYDRVRRRTGASPDEVRNPANLEIMFAAAMTYLEDRGLMDDVRAGRSQAVSRGINGGRIGMADRLALKGRARIVLQGQRVRYTPTTVERRDTRARAAAASGVAAPATATAVTQTAPAPVPEHPPEPTLLIAIGAGAVFAIIAAWLGWSAWADHRRVIADEAQTQENRMEAA